MLPLGSLQTSAGVKMVLTPPSCFFWPRIIAVGAEGFDQLKTNLSCCGGPRRSAKNLGHQAPKALVYRLALPVLPRFGIRKAWLGSPDQGRSNSRSDAEQLVSPLPKEGCFRLRHAL